MLFPYRVKNPPKHFPFVTLTLILINIVVFALTSQNYLVIRADVVDNYAFHLGVMPIINVFTSAFLHGDIFHLFFNMIFLWVFGPPVEGRLRPHRFLLLYFVTGFVGFMLQGMLDTVFLGGTNPIIGASGCIMGILGAYWFLFSWSPVLVFYWFFFFIFGVTEIAAFWIIGFYLFWDLIQGLLYGVLEAHSGIAFFAHAGGGFSGVFLCVLMRMKRDSESLSYAKAIQSDTKDLNNMPLHALEEMIEADPGNIDMLWAMIHPALKLNRLSVVETAMANAGPGLISKDPNLVYHYLIDIRGDHTIYKPVYLLRLAGWFERSGEHQKAIQVYKLIIQKTPTDLEIETALYRIALCFWNGSKDGETAVKCLQELHKRFPNSEMMPFARTLYKQIKLSKQ